MVILVTCKMNFFQVVNMCLISIKYLYISDFISKLAIKQEASKSKTSLAREKESFIV